MKIVVTVIHIHQRVNVKLEKILMMIYNLLHQYRMMIIYLYQSTIMNKIKCLNVVMINQQCEFIFLTSSQLRCRFKILYTHTHTYINRLNEINKINFSVIRENISWWSLCTCACSNTVFLSFCFVLFSSLFNLSIYVYVCLFFCRSRMIEIKKKIYKFRFLFFLCVCV